jgi:hypothetical protein
VQKEVPKILRLPGYLISNDRKALFKDYNLAAWPTWADLSPEDCERSEYEAPTGPYRQLSPTQVTSIKMLLDKTLPVLSAQEVTGGARNVDGNPP